MVWYNNSNTLSNLLQSLARNGLLPAEQSLFSNEDFMIMLGEETINRIVPFIVGLNEGYFLKTTWYSIINSTSYLLSNAPQSGAAESGPSPEYPFPADAVGKRLHDVSVYWGGQGNRMDSLAQVTDYQAGRMHGRQRGVYIEGDHFTLYPAIDFQNATHLRLSYRGQPLPLCDDSGTRTDGPTGAQIQTLTLSGTTYQATFLSSATTISTWSAGHQVNIINGDPGFATMATVSVFSASSNSLFFAAADVQDAFGRPLIAVNSWVSDVGFSPVLQLPREGAQMAVYAVLSKAMKAMNNEMWQIHEKTYLDLQEAAKNLFAPRIDDSPKILQPVMRGRGGGWFY